MMAKIRVVDAGASYAMRNVAYLMTAAWELGIARFVLLTWPARRIVQHLSNGDRDVPLERSGLELQRVSWALGTVARRVPWRSDCLIQALAASRWLRRRGHYPEFHLGVTNPHGRNSVGHAWVTCEGVEICGGAGDGFRKII